MGLGEGGDTVVGLGEGGDTGVGGLVRDDPLGEAISSMGRTITSTRTTINTMKMFAVYIHVFRRSLSMSGPFDASTFESLPVPWWFGSRITCA